jgi:ABC-type glycerol-3-phosphate transport system substrate-binding protein
MAISHQSLDRRQLMIGIAAAATLGRPGVAQAQEEATLRFWKPPGLAVEQETAFYAELAERYASEHPGITIEHLVVPWESAFENYTATLASGDVPDVTYQILPWINAFRGQGALAPLEDIGDATALFEGVYEAILAGGAGDDGKHYGLPYYGSHWVLAINEAVWERAGSPAEPTTYEEMIPFAQAMTFDANGNRLGEDGFDPNNIDVYGFSNPGAWSIQTNYIWNYLWSYGAEMISEDRGDIGFNNAEGRAALEVMKAMADSGAATPLTLYSDPTDWGDLLPSGRAGMSWFERISPTVNEDYPDVRIRVLETPSGPAGQHIVGGAGYLTIPSRSEHQQEALEFIAFLIADDNLREYLRQTQLYPVREISEDIYAGIGEPQESFVTAAAEQGKYTRLTPVGLAYNPEELIVGEINNYLTGQKDLDSMLSDLSRQVQIMARNAGQ